MKPGEFVVTSEGRVGMIVDTESRQRYVVKFGEGGPFARYSWVDLRYASKDDLARADLVGVGGDIVREDFRKHIRGALI